MKNIKIIILFILSFSFSQFREIPDIVTKVGSAAAPWLRLETGIRAVGMAGAQTASGKGKLPEGAPYYWMHRVEKLEMNSEGESFDPAALE